MSNRIVQATARPREKATIASASFSAVNTTPVTLISGGGSRTVYIYVLEISLSVTGLVQFQISGVTKAQWYLNVGVVGGAFYGLIPLVSTSGGAFTITSDDDAVAGYYNFYYTIG